MVDVYEMLNYFFKLLYAKIDKLSWSKYIFIKRNIVINSCQHCKTQNMNVKCSICTVKSKIIVLDKYL